MRKLILAAFALVLALVAWQPAAAQYRDTTRVNGLTAGDYGRNLMRRLNDTGPNAWAGATNETEYHPSFVTMINENGRLAGRNYGGPDYEGDPVCQCQDGGAEYQVISANQAGSRFFHLRFGRSSRFANGHVDRTEYTVVITPYRGHWRVWDVVTREGSTRMLLTRHNACLRAAGGAQAIDRCFARAPR